MSKRSSVGQVPQEFLAALRQANTEQVWGVRRWNVTTPRSHDRQSLTQREGRELAIGRVAGVDAVGWAAGSQLARPFGEVCLVDHAVPRLQSTCMRGVVRSGV